MLLTNWAQSKSCTKITTNKKGITNTRWYPYNCILLNNPDIQGIIIRDEKLEELNITIYCKNNEKDKISSISDNISLPSTNEEFLYKPSNPSTKFNLVFDFVSEYIEKIVQYNNLYHIRENIQKY